MLRVCLYCLLLVCSFLPAQNLKVFEDANQYLLNTYKLEDYCLSGNAKVLAVKNEEGIKLLDVNSGQILKTISKVVLGNGVTRMTFSEDGQYFYCALVDGTVKQMGVRSNYFQSHGRADLKVISFDLSKDGQVMAILGLIPYKEGLKGNNLLTMLTLASAGLATFGIDSKNQNTRQLSSNYISYLSQANRNSYPPKKFGNSYISFPREEKIQWSYVVQFVEINKPHKRGETVVLRDLPYEQSDLASLLRYVQIESQNRVLKLGDNLGTHIKILSTARKGFPKGISQRPIIDWATTGISNNGVVKFQAELVQKQLGIHSPRTPPSDTRLWREDNVKNRLKVVKLGLENYFQRNNQKRNQSNSDITFLSDEEPSVKSRLSDFENINVGIPKNKQESHKYAFIIGNEEYENFPNPSFTVSDARLFSKYCEMTLGVPKRNIIYVENGTTTELKAKRYVVSEILKKQTGEVEFIFYYAGHMDVDAKGNKYILASDTYDTPQLKFELKLSDFYESFYEGDNAQNLFVIDACYSGSNRDISNLSNQSIASRGRIKIQYKDDVLRGNTVALYSSSELEKSFASKSINHGIFTYSLLLNLKESKGKIPLGELIRNLHRQVGVMALKLTQNNQTPQLDYSPEVKEEWEKWRFID